MYMNMYCIDNTKCSYTYCAPLCDIPLDTTWFQSAGLSCDWLRTTGTFFLSHDFHPTIVVVNASHVPGLCSVPALCRTLAGSKYISEAPNRYCFNSMCELPGPKVLYTTPAGFGRDLIHMMSLLVGVPLHICPVGDRSHGSHPSGILQPWFECLFHTLQSTKKYHTPCLSSILSCILLPHTHTLINSFCDTL